jgi:pyruvate dehydrogenase E2 component (dihydrolipoamide acetyltransferase)
VGEKKISKISHFTKIFSCRLPTAAFYRQPMPKYLEMPKLSDTMVEGTLARWVKKEGDKVAAGDVVAEIQTDKSLMEMPVFSDGILFKLYVKDGDVVPLGGAMAMVLEDGEAPPADLSAPAAKAAPAKAADAAAPGASRTPAARGARPGVKADPNARVKASPLAKKIAAERGVDLRGMDGTGPGGRIVRVDVENAPVGGARGPATPVIRPTIGPDDTKVPLSPMRAIIAERLLASKQQIPHFYLNIEVDAAPLLALRAQVNAAAEATTGVKYTVNDFILKAVAATSRQVPAANAAFDVDGIVKFASVNVAVAIAIEDGLVTPVIRDADKKSLQEISSAVKDLADRAKKMRLTPDEFAGGTITVSNLGAYGIDNFDAIINPPQAAILSIGAAKKKAVVNAKGELTVGDRMWIGMSCDHRVIDGAVGATYLATLKKLLENPALALV